MVIGTRPIVEGGTTGLFHDSLSSLVETGSEISNTRLVIWGGY